MSTRQQSDQESAGTAEQVRTPLLAALGAGDIAAHAVADTVHKVRVQLNESAESARAGVNDLPKDFNELRDKLDPAELRKFVDSYTQSAVQFYGYLAERGEGTLGKLQSQPQVQRAQERFEEAVGDARGIADDVLGKVTTSARSFGEKAAHTTEETAEETAEAVRETGSQAASATRSTARKTANRTAAAKSNGGKQSAKSTSSNSN
ncbi:heparin binding hemagglutinin HbhA [Saccharopolyspora lacisalsi]|uniref:Heparin binding hemagglutinin HbhA n=1 Tax=Halosaccharopolyspora lacisalsi TaxID=1000566 RepID=A0A839E8K5_9PSEU|nr:hypothetical protein [Halosaccharopolyspora lacisalsi]MBA8827188.1 heparin binding hemagglutinin HbhA [Halosaccharopolyspora lacisalsi]